MLGETLTVEANGHSWQIVDPGDRIGQRIRATGRPYEYRLLSQIRQEHPKGSALDVGAHVGNHTLYLAIVCGLTVHAFEADSDRVDELRRNVDLNALEGVHVHPYAAGAATGRASWAANDMTLSVGDGPIDVRRVDDVVDLDDLAVVKVDAEGMEPQALEGMREHLSRCRPLVWTEVHTDDARRRQAAVLEPLGYRPTRRIAMGSVMERWETG